ncbi:MAG: hypothetical protein V1664_05125 [Candidatus Uhrbacteria bacterium]
MDQEKTTALEVAIVRTLAWFSLFEYPLTAFELWKYLYQPDKKYSLIEVEKTLSESQRLTEKINFERGFYFWPKNKDDDFVSVHQTKFLDAAKKYKKLRRAAYYFSLLPFVRAVFTCNNLDWHNTAPGSDIDLFIVVKPGTIWLSRLLLVAPFALFKKRPHPYSTPLQPRGRGWGGGADPFCFSFFTTADNLNFKNLLLPESDPYFVYWLASLMPIFDREEIQKKIWQENSWLKEILPNVFPRNIHEEIQPKHLWVLPLDFLKMFEDAARYWQQKFLPCELRDTANLDSRVVISEQMLKFHTNDRRQHFYDEWQKRLAKIL